MTPKSHRRNLAWLGWLLKLAIATALLGYLVRSGKLSWDIFQASLGGPGLILAGGAAALVFLAQMIASLRLYILFKSQGLDLSWSLCWQTTLMGLFANNYLPTSIGGDAVRAYYLVKGRTDQVPQIIATMVFDRSLGLAALVLLVLAILGLTTKGSFAFAWKLDSGWGYGILTVVLVAAFSSLGLLRWPRLREGIRSFLTRHQVGVLFYQFFNSLLAFRHQGRTALACLGISFITHLLCALALYLISQALGLKTGLLLTMALAPLIFLTGILPLSPGNVGWTEYLGALLWSSQGLSWGGNLWLAYRMVTVLVSLSGLILFLRLKQGRPG
ncbi:MAG: hypothetical protein A2Y80_02475 [Deltaproteobacteria bacterium RBG_13_58_19]|nr:MAG: hypothetical protein A2Y80_02475 [Deltaproteobacteria bacterium RBG_13_58_19]